MAIWLVLLLLLLLDYKTIEYLRHGPDVIYFDEQGRMLPKPPLSAMDFTALGVLVGLQVLLLIKQHRLRKRA